MYFLHVLFSPKDHNISWIVQFYRELIAKEKFFFKDF